MAELKAVLAELGLRAETLRVVRTTDLGEVHAFAAPGGAPAVTAWERLRSLHGRTAHWPVLLGPPDEAIDREEWEEGYDDSGTVADILSRATIGVPAWFDTHAQERIEELRSYNQDEDPADFGPELGDWPDEDEVAPSDSFVTPYDILSREPHEQLEIALVPTADPWAVPAYLKIGGWNECPPPEEHVAVMRYWHEAYGAEIVAATRDVIEMRVRRPPATRDAAIELAMQQYAYCTDIVEQGTETIARLAAGLLNGTAWYFWWD